jgi:hypothetical protein
MSEQGFTVNDFQHLGEAQGDACYGIYDTRDNCWLGDETGPRVFTREDSDKAKGMPQRIMAQIAAQMAEKQLGYGMGRLRAQEFRDGDFTLKDEVPTKMNALEALIRVENGG